jgi:hypothetical protein
MILILKNLECKKQMTLVYPNILARSLMTAFRDTVCFSQNENTLTCINIFSSTEDDQTGPFLNLVSTASVLDPQLYGINSADGVVWRDQWGSVSNYNFTDAVTTQYQNIRTSQFQALSEGLAALVYQSQTSFMRASNLTLPSLALTSGISDFVLANTAEYNQWMCFKVPAVGGTASKFSCTFNQCADLSDFQRNCLPYTIFTASSFTNVATTSNVIGLDIVAGVYSYGTGTDKSIGFLGVPRCPLALNPAVVFDSVSINSCSDMTPPTLISPPPFNLPSTVSGQVHQISVGNWGVCILHDSPTTLTCETYVSYSSFTAAATPVQVYNFPQPWLNVESVTRVQVYDDGACIQFLLPDQAQGLSCWGSPLQTFSSLSANGLGDWTLFGLTINLAQRLADSQLYEINQLQPTFSCSLSDIVFSNTCIPCPFGYFVSASSLPEYPYCAPCSSNTPVRGINQSVCSACNLGSQSSADFSSCIPCPPNSINSISGSLSCQVCGPGSQSNASGQACVPCPDGQVRGLGEDACHVCIFPSYSNTRTSACTICPSPLYPSLSSNPASVVCTPCEAGFFPNDGGSCSACAPPFVRNSTQLTCTACPVGTEAKADLINCQSCTGNTIRNLEKICVACPFGKFANETHDTCISTSVLSRLGLTRIQTACISTGLLIAFSSFAASTKLPKAMVYIGILLGICIAGLGYALN